ncbi:hypothetical protein CTA1_3890 [Colletotrichum tanaceti]|uniref:Uncharacterized protein n=1 Tax=Colletotrichum tanaceti TaxID=1306861 RepID=A0A4U6XRI1_9PEZI|nr:hypothetical protein CTA1_3890 [Colletotrichum tanaceti]
MDTRTQAISWYEAVMTCSLLSSDYPTIVRYISAAFVSLVYRSCPAPCLRGVLTSFLKIVLGFIFFVPIILLVTVDFGIYIYRICWSRPWNQNRNQPAHLSEPGHHHEEQVHKLVTSTVATAARKRIQRLSESEGGGDASSA